VKLFIFGGVYFSYYSLPGSARAIIDGGHHERAATGFLFTVGVGGDSDARLGANGFADGSAGGHPGLLRHLGSPGLARRRAAGSRPWTGTNTSHRNGGSNPYELVGDHTNPILQPHAAHAVKTQGENELGNGPAPTPSNQCWPGGVPFVLYNIGMQMIQQPDKITILYSNDHEVRHVRLNEPHPAIVTPSWYGDSVGHYEGDMLVVDTVGVKVGPFAMVDMYGTPHTQALHIVERYRLLDADAAREAEDRGEKNNFRLPNSDPGFAPDRNYKGKGLALQFTVEDDGVFTTPWTAGITYRRPLGGWPEMVCAENPHKYRDGKAASLPTADKPDF
jgi:hypothetical protein